MNEGPAAAPASTSSATRSRSRSTDGADHRSRRCRTRWCSPPQSAIESFSFRASGMSQHAPRLTAAIAAFADASDARLGSVQNAQRRA